MHATLINAHFKPDTWKTESSMLFCQANKLYNKHALPLYQIDSPIIFHILYLHTHQERASK